MVLAASLFVEFLLDAPCQPVLTNMTTKNKSYLVIYCFGFFLLGFFAAGLSSVDLKEEILYTTFLGAVGAFLSFFLQFTYAEGHIFFRYYRWLEKLRDDPKHLLHTLANPLGLCAYCQNIWVTTIAFFFAYLWIADLEWYMFFPATAIAHFTLAVLDKFFWHDFK
jgi:hypothetical protein